MATNERSSVIGVFTNRDQADRAIDALRQAGFSYNQIRLVERGTGSFLDNLKSLFASQGTTAVNTADDLRKMGVPEQDANDYQSQLEAGHAIVLANTDGHLEQAISILRQNGAYDINARFKIPQPATPEQAAPAGAYGPGAQPGPSNPNVPPAAGPYNNPNAPPGPSNPNVPPEAPRRE